MRRNNACYSDYVSSLLLCSLRSWRLLSPLVHALLRSFFPLSPTFSVVKAVEPMILDLNGFNSEGVCLIES